MFLLLAAPLSAFRFPIGFLSAAVGWLKPRDALLLFSFFLFFYFSLRDPVEIVVYPEDVRR